MPILAGTTAVLAARMLAEVDLAPAQELLLARLWAHEPSAKEELTEASWAEAPTVAKMLTRMEAAGLVEGERPQDRRVLLVALTDEGRALCVPVTRIWTTHEEATAKD